MTNLVIDDVTPHISYTVGGTPQTVFVIPFVWFEDSDLVVTVGGVTLTLTTDYTATGAGVSGGGTLTLGTAVSSTTVVISRVLIIERITDFPESGPLSIAALNLEFDRQTAMIQQAAETVAPSPDTFFFEPQVRATLTTGVAVTTSDVAGATSIYATPANGCAVQINDGSVFQVYSLSVDLVLALDSNSSHTGYHQSGKIFSLFLCVDSGVVRLGTGPAWTSDTSPGTGAGTAEIHLLNGIQVNTNAITLRFGSAVGNTLSVAANRSTCIGWFRATADGQASDTVLKRLLFNLWQIAPRLGLVQEAGVNWTYSTAAFRQVNGSTANQVEVLLGPATLVSADAFNVVQNSTSTPRTIASGIGIDSSTVNSARSQLQQCVDAPIATSESAYTGYPGMGWHEIRWLERGNGTDTQTWYGNNAGAAVHRSGLQLEFWG